MCCPVVSRGFETLTPSRSLRLGKPPYGKGLSQPGEGPHPPEGSRRAQPDDSGASFGFSPVFSSTNPPLGSPTLR